jgi:hypothetical protein
MKGLFSDDEWEQLKFLPFQAFFLVSTADGKVDAKEARTLTDQVERSALLLDPLHRELLVDVAREDHRRYLDGASPERLAHTRDVVKPLLRSRLSDEQYTGFVRSLFIASLEVAKASGGGFLRLQNKVSEAEAEALATLAMLYDVDVESLMSEQ